MRDYKKIVLLYWYRFFKIKIMKLIRTGLLFFLTLIITLSCTRSITTYNDPMNTITYTLDNGLKVYMTVNKESPRIQTYIAVKVGGKNDPADNTGLAHYLEHIMFKGTDKLGTSNYEAEKPLLDSIESLYNIYRTKTDKNERLRIYKKIDSISYKASKYAIANEYDKAMSLIGAEGSNAFTSNDLTCYQEDIPSNQIENWAKVQSDRFINMVVRGFHTELEAVYEEKNIGLGSDDQKVFAAIDSMLFPNHPYGKQTVIGTQEHLKNPSITAIKRQKETYYVPNNCAICLSGDFDPKETIEIIKKYFGNWKPNKNIPELQVSQESPISVPKEKVIIGQEAEYILMGWKFPGAATKDGEIGIIVRSILNNGMAGLLDLDVNQKQKAINAWAFNYDRADYCSMLVSAYPKTGQTLQEVRDILLTEVSKLRKGDFNEDIIKAAINNYKLKEMKELESNQDRAMKFVESFINGETWANTSKRLERLSKLSKQDIVSWAEKYLGDNNYVVVYKRKGIDNQIKKIDAPAITPIETNRDKESNFLKEIANSKVKPIEPIFTDYKKELSVLKSDKLEVLYKKNELNDIATIAYRYDIGKINDAALPIAFDYISYLGTPKHSAEEIANKLYSLACRFYTKVGNNTLTIYITGLSENLPEAMDIVEDLYANATGNDSVLENIKSDELKSRSDNKMNNVACKRALMQYVMFGSEYVHKSTLNKESLDKLTSTQLLDKVKDILGKQHKVLYYGPVNQEKASTLLKSHHNIPAVLKPVIKTPIKRVLTPKSIVYVTNYDAPQFNYLQFSNRGEKFDITQAPQIELFNTYFGNGMNSIVFQEMREARALAYNAGAYLFSPEFKDDDYSFYAVIGSQTDKLKKVIEAFNLIINNMPKSEKAFNIAKSSLMTSLRTKRTTGMDVLYSYLHDKELGLNEPIDKYIFERLSDMQLSDLTKTSEKWIYGRTYIYGVLGKINALDMSSLKALGEVKVISEDELFGY